MRRRLKEVVMKDPQHSGHNLFSLLPSGRRYSSATPVGSRTDFFQQLSGSCTSPNSANHKLVWVHQKIAGLGPRLHPLSFGEGVEVDPLPPKEIRYTSSVKYDSDRHYINNVFLQHTLGVGSCSQTVICVPDCTWRNYKTELKFELQHKPLRFLSAVIVYPKYAKTVYTTTVDYNCRKAARRFLSSVELEVTDYMTS
ncbi:refilin-B-like isoform X6 [Narcine bancroftii]|uniref:refilin-B-like isoform X6 n=1 Tax=Narcine bancroftii TaxID=1343680 RepID=UPI0038315D57